MYRYFIKNKDGHVLHYIKGDLFWFKLNTWEVLCDMTSFDSYSAAKNFVNNKNIIDFESIGKVIIRIA